MILLRILGLRGVLLIALVAVVLAMAVRIDWLTGDRDAAEARLTAVEIELLNARADADQAESRLRTVTATLETERTRALASERLASPRADRPRRRHRQRCRDRPGVTRHDPGPSGAL